MAAFDEPVFPARRRALLLMLMVATGSTPAAAGQHARAAEPWIGADRLQSPGIAAQPQAPAAAEPGRHGQPPAQSWAPLADDVVIRRTAYGVPHILAESLRAFGFGLAYVQVEDYGLRVPQGLIAARGELARHVGYHEIDSDFVNRRRYERAVETYHLLPEDTRAVLEGFAAGVNYYVELHADEFPEWLEPDFSGYDVAARGVRGPSLGAVRDFLERIEARRDSGRVAAEIGAAGRVAAGIDPAALFAKSRAASAAIAGCDATTRAAEHRGLGVASTVRPGSLDGSRMCSSSEDAAGAVVAHAAKNPWALAARRAEPAHADDGSNAWALAPSRTESGHAILLRNPHLSWDAGYYEAHVTVPGELNFYGDFRVGGPFGVIGGFNERLGWATTNNGPDLDEIYALDVDPDRPDHYLFNGASLAIHREEVTVEFRNGDGLGSERRVFLETSLGPVIHRGDGKIYIYRAARLGEYRVGTELLRMMRAQNLEAWKAAKGMLADWNSNYTYADADGNIFYIWNAAVPVLPHPSGGDTAAVPASNLSDVWTRVVPFDSLPQLLNPQGGYVHNENDSFHFTNLNQILAPDDFPLNFPKPEFDLRSQHSVLLVGGDDELSLEDVVRLKHSMRMLLADRVKDDLVAAVRTADPAPEVARATAMIEEWDNTVAPESRGGVLFQTWWERYVETADTADDTPASVGFDARPESLFREPWTPDDPAGTPRGLADPERAAAAFAWAVEETEERWGRSDIAWGEAHRVRRGDVDLPVGGCTGALGCFRVLSYREAEDGKLVARRGDGWVIAVEFSDPPRAYSILAYGQSARSESPHFDDQAAMFARGEMKPVAFTEEAIAEQLVVEYHPGEEPRAAGQP